MAKHVVYIYAISLLSLIGIVIFFNKTYQELSTYANLSNKQSTVYSIYQDISKEITNVVVLTPKLTSAGQLLKTKSLLFTDSVNLINKLGLLKSTVSDSVNIRITHSLDSVVKSELSWLLVSNVSDSIINKNSQSHIASLQHIDSLVNMGIKRTSFLILYRKEQLNKEIDNIRIWMLSFILLSGGFIIYTSINLYRQKTKTHIKEKEITDYKYALDESSIVAITDQKGIIKYVNNNFCKISKYSKDELLGQDHRIINSGYHSKELIRNLWVTIANGKIWKGDLKNKAKDGTIYWVDTTIVPFLDERNKPYQYVAIRADITERKRTEERLLKSEKIYKTIASSIPGSVICTLNDEYRYMLIEGDMIEKLGYKKDLLLGKKAADVLPADVFADVKEAFKLAFEGTTVTTESNILGYDIVTRFIPLKDEQNYVYKIMTVAMDVTGLKKAQHSIAELNRSLEEKIVTRTEQLRLANKELENFSYSVSHDLRSPLRIIDGYGQILLEDYSPILDEAGRQSIEIIMRNAKRMGRLIDDLLDFSRSGKKELKISNVNMNVLVAEAVQELKSGGIPFPAHFTCNDLPMVNADENLLRQVWINLISNAVKYSGTKTNPEVEIGMLKNKDGNVYYIKDNGVGFNMNYAGKLFGVFQRLHKPHEFSGTGVGLALVQRIIIRHGGKIWAEAKENEGATFYFTLAAAS